MHQLLAPAWRLAVNADMDKNWKGGGEGGRREEGGREGERPSTRAVISIDLKSN